MASDRWGEANLSEWLAGPYREATRWGLGKRRTPSTPPRSVTLPAAGGAVNGAERVEALLREARWYVLAALDGLSLPGGSHAFVDRALASGHVAPRRDGEASAVNATWVPVDLPEMTLRDRVESLLAADHLARPRDYALELLVCPCCETVVFDAEARARGDCGAHDTAGYTREASSWIRRVTPHDPR